jgi:hypothetical protein
MAPFLFMPYIRFISGKTKGRGWRVVRKFLRCILLVAGCCWGSGVSAEAPQAQADSGAAESETDGLILRSLSVAESVRDQWSERWVGFSEGVDRFLSDEQAVSAENNSSYLKLQIHQSFFEEGGYESDVRLKAKLDLPNTERKMKLFFSSDPDQDNDLTQRASIVSSGERIRRDNSVAGIELVPDSFWHDWKRSYRLGLKLHIPPEPYGRARFQRKFSEWRGWAREFNQEFSYYHTDGWGEVSEFRLTRPFNEKYTFNYLISLEFEDRDDYFQNLHLFVLSRRLSDRSSSDYRVGGIYTTEGHGQPQRYFAAYNFYRRLHKDWVYLTMTPEVSFSRSRDWQADPAVTFRLDVYFSE